MNKHVNKNRLPVTPAANRSELSFDHMPAEVATSLLLSSPRVTNRQRKDWMKARSRIFQSTLEKKPVEDKLAHKFQSASWAQIVKWHRRGDVSGREVEDAYGKALRMRHKLATSTAVKDEHALVRDQTKIAVLDKLIAGLEVKRAQLMTFMDSVNREVDRRRKFISDLRDVTSSVADAVQAKLCPAS